jgi:hypothetical protein
MDRFCMSWIGCTLLCLMHSFPAFSRRPKRCQCCTLTYAPLPMHPYLCTLTYAPPQTNGRGRFWGTSWSPRSLPCSVPCVLTSAEHEPWEERADVHIFHGPDGVDLGPKPPGRVCTVCVCVWLYAGWVGYCTYRHGVQVSRTEVSRTISKPRTFV